jgi:Mrp family chromosome partitioning ATPase
MGDPGGLQAADADAVIARKGVILSMGGKGGVGKTSTIVSLAEWFNSNQIPVRLFDLSAHTRNLHRENLERSA